MTFFLNFRTFWPTFRSRFTCRFLLRFLLIYWCRLLGFNRHLEVTVSHNHGYQRKRILIESLIVSCIKIVGIVWSLQIDTKEQVVQMMGNFLLHKVQVARCYLIKCDDMVVSLRLVVHWTLALFELKVFFECSLLWSDHTQHFIVYFQTICVIHLGYLSQFIKDHALYTHVDFFFEKFNLRLQLFIFLCLDNEVGFDQIKFSDEHPVNFITARPRTNYIASNMGYGELCANPVEFLELCLHFANADASYDTLFDLFPSCALVISLWIEDLVYKGNALSRPSITDRTATLSSLHLESLC